MRASETVGYRNQRDGKAYCLDTLCLMYAERPVFVPVVENNATDEGRFLACSICDETLDERAEIVQYLDAPIPAPGWVATRARELGILK